MSRTLAVACLGAALATTTGVAQVRQGGQGASRGQRANGNAIVGRVTVPSGQPAAGAFVTALNPATSGDREFTPVSAQLHELTDADGRYRLDGLAIGEYFIVALPKNETGTPKEPVHAGFGKTFYPNAADVTAAKRVRVDGVNPSQADISLAPTRLGLLTGIVISSNGQPATGGTVSLAHGDGLFGLDSKGVRLAPDGRFIFPPQAPGTYFVVYHESTWPPPRGEVPLISQTKVVMTGADQLDLRVAPIHMVQVSGHLTIDGPPPSPTDLMNMTVSASPVDFNGNPGPARPGAPMPDLSFTFKIWAYVARVRVSPESAWVVKAVRLNGVGVTTTGIDATPGKDLKGLEVEIARRY